MLVVIEWVRFLIVICVLGYAAYQDYLHGKVLNRVWRFGLLSFPLAIIVYTVFVPELLNLYIASAAITVGLALGIFYVTGGNGWGGADSKALIMLGLALPLSPLLWSRMVLVVPLFGLGVASFTSLAVYVVTRKKEVRFLPYLLLGVLVISLFPC